MPIFVVTGFPASYDPPEDESIVLPPGAGRRFKGVPFGVTDDTAAVLRTLSYLDEVTDEVEEAPPTLPTDDTDTVPSGLSDSAAQQDESGPQIQDKPEKPKPVGTDRPSKTKE